MSDPYQEHPPVPRLVVRVGVTGHREGPDLASAELRAAIRETLVKIQTTARDILQRSKGFYTGSEPVLRVISPLAEGADRLVAEEAIELGYELEAPLPFLQRDYEQDFGPESVERFRHLLKKARAVFELDGSRETKESTDEAYEAVGHLVLRQCDVLIAVWDGKPARGVGGTAEIVESALSIEIPTIRIDLSAPHAIELRSPGVAPESSDWIGERLARLFLPPSPKEEDTLRHFLQKERLGSRDEVPELPQDLRHGTDSILRTAFTWADSLANHYARKYRRSYKAIYLLGAMAVLFAYLGSIEPVESLAHKVFLSTELVTIGVIALIALRGWSSHWHERWLDLRHLAESLRTTRLLALFGRVTADFQVPAHLEKGDPRKTWFHWYFRALVRESGLVAARMTPEYLEQLREALSKNVATQVDYHADKAKSSHDHHHVWHRVAQGSFLVAAAACVLHFFFHEQPMLTTLNLLVIVLPAFGGAIGAILNQGEADRIARRSEALKERLEKLQNDLKALAEAPNSRELSPLVERFSGICLGELMDWRFLFLDRPLTLPA